MTRRDGANRGLRVAATAAAAAAAVVVARCWRDPGDAGGSISKPIGVEGLA